MNFTKEPFENNKKSLLYYTMDSYYIILENSTSIIMDKCALALTNRSLANRSQQATKPILHT